MLIFYRNTLREDIFADEQFSDKNFGHFNPQF